MENCGENNKIVMMSAMMGFVSGVANRWMKFTTCIGAYDEMKTRIAMKRFSGWSVLAGQPATGVKHKNPVANGHGDGIVYANSHSLRYEYLEKKQVDAKPDQDSRKRRGGKRGWGRNTHSFSIAGLTPQLLC
ncbi:hypothetical protein MKZ38_006679 [Zalerion maritima]|uniref:Uncharacterized protein n=1 Tax=Zalerion maritima TaxID=339359 RepID=A0AAD5RVD0_9PEZI|nr:hypothetical protein MKZ38_006679 [Zalerion maritima]